MGNQLGSRIKELLEEKGISRKELSEMTGLTEAAISRYINGQREPRSITLAIIARALGTSADDLLGTPCDDPNKLDGAINLVARSANIVTPEQKKRLIDALLKYC